MTGYNKWTSNFAIDKLEINAFLEVIVSSVHSIFIPTSLRSKICLVIAYK